MGLLLLGLMFLVFDHPMMLVIMLVVLTLFVSFWSYCVFLSYWYGYMIVLIILSGVLVVFTYMASLIPNEGFFFDFLGVMVVFVVVFDWGLFCGGDDQSLLSMRLWDGFDGFLNLFVLASLFICMVMVIWLGGGWKGPVRIS